LCHHIPGKKLLTTIIMKKILSLSLFLALMAPSISHAFSLSDYLPRLRATVITPEVMDGARTRAEQYNTLREKRLEKFYEDQEYKKDLYEQYREDSKEAQKEFVDQVKTPTKNYSERIQKRIEGIESKIKNLLEEKEKLQSMLDNPETMVRIDETEGEMLPPIMPEDSEDRQVLPPRPELKIQRSYVDSEKVPNRSRFNQKFSNDALYRKLRQAEAVRKSKRYK